MADTIPHWVQLDDKKVTASQLSRISDLGELQRIEAEARRQLETIQHDDELSLSSSHPASQTRPDLSVTIERERLMGFLQDLESRKSAL